MGESVLLAGICRIDYRSFPLSLFVRRSLAKILLIKFHVLVGSFFNYSGVVNFLGRTNFVCRDHWLSHGESREVV